MKQTTILKLLLAVQVLLFFTMCVVASAKPSGHYNISHVHIVCQGYDSAPRLYQ